MTLPWHDTPPRRIVVFRALQLGDMLCAIPALRAMRQAWPTAHIALIGLPNAASFVARFSRYIDELIIFPGIPEFPEQIARVHELPAFYANVRDRRFDLAVQMQGSGGPANDIVAGLGAAHWVGFVPDPALDEPGRLLLWPDELPEALRFTALMQHIGLDVDDTRLEFPFSTDDDVAVDRLVDACGIDVTRTIVIHPGARLLSRRWPVERFAQVGQALAVQGWQLAVTGSDDERALTRTLLAALPAGAADLTGQTSLGSLAALLARTRLLICNDTGVSHVAAGVRARSVVVASGSDVNRWAPLDRHLHRVLWHDVPCRPCGYHACPIGHPCALGVSADAVLAVVHDQLAAPVME